ncbi:MAG: hypothetical protein J0H23_00110 [Micrococcales bacterium]|nr:hypothetical protein [Micrococcales bacterium]OJX66868.1 MAG: hypothetical protein BGO94_08565 [Micrococcales bacterium 72-143]
MERTRIPIVALLAASALGLTACTAAAPAPTESPRPSESSSRPSPTPDPIVTPDAAAPDQLAISMVEPATDIPTTPLITGPALLEADMQIRISAQCSGGTLGWRLVTASTELDEQRTFAEGTTRCDGKVDESAVGPVVYTGPVQLILTDTASVDEGWVQARQVPLR